MALRCVPITLMDIHVGVCRAHKIPGGIKPAFATIQSKLTQGEKRQIFGLTYCAEEEPEFFAAVEVYNRNDLTRLDLPKMVIPGGAYVRALFPDTRPNPTRINTAFRELEQRFEFDFWRPKIEFYRESRKLHLYLPVKSTPAGNGKSS